MTNRAVSTKALAEYGLKNRGRLVTAAEAGTTKGQETRMNTPSFSGLRQVGSREKRARRRDFYDRYDLLLANWYLLTNRMQRQIEVIREDLHDELGRWRPHEPEPDWNAYAERVNMIGREGGSRLRPGSTH